MKFTTKKGWPTIVKGININRVEWTKSSTGGWDMKPVEGSEQYFPADLVLLSMGFLGPDDRLFEGEIELSERRKLYSRKQKGVPAV